MQFVHLTSELAMVQFSPKYIFKLELIPCFDSKVLGMKSTQNNQLVEDIPRRRNLIHAIDSLNLLI